MSVAIVIPVHGRSALTRRCLDGLLAEPAARAAQIVVVDDGSRDDTAAVLAGYGAAIRVHVRERAGGFATACNEGAELTDAPLLVFLNNDTLGEPGWLATLLADAGAHPEAAAIGAKLLFPDGSVQHAGVAIGRDGLPRHLYAGFPAEHPAVSRSRAFQAVTGACLLVRRTAWEQAGGFDAGYHNGLEDTDLCLRLGALGHGVRCCHESVLVHLESPTRGRRGPDIDAGVARFRARWGEHVRPDDLEHFAADGLLRVDYTDTHPVRLTVSPLLAAVNDREEERERLLVRRAAQVNELLRETVRLSVELAAVEAPAEAAVSAGPAAAGWSAATGARADHTALLHRAQAIEAQISALQRELADAFPDAPLAQAGASPLLAYRQLVERLRRRVREAVPAGATVMVISRGDDELVDLDDRAAWHFPQSEHGEYRGHHPADSGEAIAHLEDLRARGGTHLVVPSTAYWWLDHYEDFARHLTDRYRAIVRDADTCLVYELAQTGAGDGDR
jgi:GT2 family glycosyltransferase